MRTAADERRPPATATARPAPAHRRPPRWLVSGCRRTTRCGHGRVPDSEGGGWRFAVRGVAGAGKARHGHGENVAVEDALAGILTRCPRLAFAVFWGLCYPVVRSTVALMRTQYANGETAEGARVVREMPDPVYAGLWDAIVVDGSVKDRLLRAAVMNLRLRADLPFETTALHGLVLLHGPPGRGRPR